MCLISESTSLPCPIDLFLYQIQLKLELFFSFPDLDGLATNSDGQFVVLTLQISFMAHELWYVHIGQLLHLRLFGLRILPCIRSHIWVLSSFDWGIVLRVLTFASLMWCLRFLGLPAEWGVVQVIFVLWLLIQSKVALEHLLLAINPVDLMIIFTAPFLQS